MFFLLKKKLEKVEVNNILIENESFLCYFFNDELWKDILNFDRYVLNTKCVLQQKKMRKKVSH